MRLPDFMIIGAMKSATSSLHASLAAQPGVFMSTPKEPCFFSDDENWSRGLEWYAGLFAAAPAGAIIGESSTHYTKRPTYPETVARSRSVVPGARLVYVMRHPIDRLVSHYIHEWTQGHTRGEIDAEIESNEIYRAYSRYAFQITPWLEAFGVDRVLPVFFDRLKARPAEELERVCRFIGVDGPIVMPDGAAKQNVSADRLRKGPLLRFIMQTPGVSQVRRGLVPRAAREWVKDRFFRMKRRPVLAEELRAELERELDGDLAELSGLLGLDQPLTCATFAGATRGLDDPRFVRAAADSQTRPKMSGAMR